MRARPGGFASRSATRRSTARRSTPNAGAAVAGCRRGCSRSWATTWSKRAPTADHDAMMRAWVDIVACGTALSVRKELEALRARPAAATTWRRERAARCAYARGVSGRRCISRRSAGPSPTAGRWPRFWQDHDMLLTATLAEPPARVGRFDHTTEDYVGYRIGPGRRLRLFALHRGLQRHRPARGVGAAALDRRRAAHRRAPRRPLRRRRGADRAFAPSSRRRDPGSTGARRYMPR